MVKRAKTRVFGTNRTLELILTPIAAAMLTATPAAAQQLEETIVTATRRAQSTQDVPYNISAIGANDLKNSALVNSGDLLQQIPGIFVSSVGARANINSNIAIRGINATNPADSALIPNVTEPPVATYIGDTPLFINMKLTDIERVEVLRGPQGTLYGSGSIGGAIRYLFNRPDTEEFSGEISAGVSSTDDADDLSYNTDVVLNLPLSDRTALRLAAGWEDIAGYTDARRLYVLDSKNGPATPSGDYLTSGPIIAPTEEDTDDSDTWYARASFLWDISDDVSALVMYSRQEDTFSGDSIRRITDIQTNKGPKNTHDYDRLAEVEYETDLLSAEVAVDLGFASFTSATSWSKAEVDSNIPGTELYEFLDQDADLYFGFPRISAEGHVFNEDEVFTQEFRLVSQGDSNLDWIVGAFYKKQDKDGGFADNLPGYNDWLIAGDLAEFTPVDPAYNDIPAEFLREIDFEDTAVFGELTYHVSDRWQITGGLRYFWQDFEQDVRIRFPYCSSFCASDEEDLLGTTYASSKEDFNDSIFKVNTSYDLSEEHMLYFTFSQGFRHGGANALPTSGVFGVDPSLIPYDADELDNWELGLKGSWGDRRFSYSLALFRADWDSIQLDTFLSPLLLPGVLNGETARSQGVEMEVKASLTERLVANIAYAYTDAELTDDVVLGDFPVFDGDAIPGVSEHAFSLFADYTLPLSGDSDLVFHIDASYRSDFETTFNELQPNYADLDGFEVVNLAVNWNAGAFSIGGYVNNATNEEGVTAVTTTRDGAFPESSFAYNRRPRTIGLSATYEF